MDDFNILFEAINDSAVIIDKAGRIVDWNNGATALFGYHKKEVLGRSLNLIYQQNHPFPKIIQDTLTNQKRWSAETAYIRKNGISGYCITSASLLNNLQSNKNWTLITHHNVTPYKTLEAKLQKSLNHTTVQAKELMESNYHNNLLLVKNLHTIGHLEKTLEESEIRFHLLAQNATDIISRHSMNGHYLYVSPSCKTLLNYTPEELLSTSIFKYLHYDDVNKLKKIFFRKKLTTPHYTITYRIRRREGDYRWFESNVRIIQNDGNYFAREIQCASRDVTDRVLDKKARLKGQQLAHVSRLSTMEEMASGMAHEISQPLAAVVNYTRGCVRYLQNENHDTLKIIEIMNKAVAQAERAGEVIQRLKNFFCKGEIIKTPCKINGLIRETVSLIRNDLNTSKTKIEFILEKNVQIISADKIQIQQVLLNLIHNAIEAMESIHPKQRKINILTRGIDKNAIEVTFKDTGPGFSKEMAHKIFEPFFTTKTRGRGMGLAICRSIIDAHGGQFIINPNISNDSFIRFTLPIN